MPESGKSGSVGAAGEQSPAATPPLCGHRPVWPSSQWRFSCRGTCNARESGSADAIVNNSLELQPIECKDLSRYYTLRGYGQIIIHLGAIMAEIQLA